MASKFPIVSGPSREELMFAVWFGCDREEDDDGERRRLGTRTPVWFVVARDPKNSHDRLQWTAIVDGATRINGSREKWEISGFLLDRGMFEPNGASFKASYSTRTRRGKISIF